MKTVSDKERVRAWLDRHGMTMDDVGCDCSIDDASDDIIACLCDSITDEESAEEADNQARDDQWH